MSRKGPGTVAIGFAFSLLVPAIGYFYLGPLYAILFFCGYFGGFVLWLIANSQAPWERIKIPFWTTMLSFLLLHKVEENRMKFFQVVSEKITGDPVPEVTFGLIVGLLLVPVGSWLIIPLLIKKGNQIGYYLAWSFFVSMGVTELAHFFLPLLTKEPYGYFPGMASVVVLAPLAWWGMGRLLARPATTGT